MTNFNSIEVVKALKKKGFSEIKNRNRHIFFCFEYDGKKTGINTHVSKGDHEIHENLVRCMASQMKLTKSEFVDFVKCSYTFKMYLNHLIQNRYIDIS